MNEQRRDRIVEAYIGEYASGKSEIAINRALELKRQGRRVTLVDLDIVEPFYTLRPIKEMLEGQGLKVIGFSPGDAFGLGETGAMLNPQARWALWHEGDVIMDIGYGVAGSQTLNLVEGAAESSELRIYAVVNHSRPMTGSRELIKEYISTLGRVDAIVANTHLGDQTEAAFVMEGNAVVMEAALDMGIPVLCVVVTEELADEVANLNPGVPIRTIKRYMPAAIW